VPADAVGELDADGRLAAALLAEDDRGGRAGEVADDLLEVGVGGLAFVEAREDRIVPRLFGVERVL
jgi:hypothetical protein